MTTLAKDKIFQKKINNVQQYINTHTMNRNMRTVCIYESINVFVSQCRQDCLFYCLNKATVSILNSIDVSFFSLVF